MTKLMNKDNNRDQNQKGEYVSKKSHLTNFSERCLDIVIASSLKS